MKTHAGPRISSARLRELTWLSLMAIMFSVSMLPFASYVASLSFIQRDWGMNNAQVGVVYSAFLAGYSLSALLIIPLTDRFASKYILLGSIVASTIGHLFFPLVARDMLSGSLLRGLAGAGMVGVYMPGLRVISERFPGRRRGTAMGLFVTAFYAANSISLAATGALIPFLGWRRAYLLVSLLALTSLPMAYLLLRKHQSAPTSSSGRLKLSVLRNRPTRLLILGYSLHAWELYVVRVWLPPFLMTVLIARGFEDARAAATAAGIAALLLGAGAVGPVVGGILSDRWGRTAAASAIFALSGVCSFALGWMGGLPWALILIVGFVYGWAIAADSAIYSTGVTEVANADDLGSAMAVQSFIGFLGGIISPVVFGGILDLFPDPFSWGLAFSSTGLAAVIGVGALLWLRRLPESRLLARGRR